MTPDCALTRKLTVKALKNRNLKDPKLGRTRAAQNADDIYYRGGTEVYEYHDAAFLQCASTSRPKARRHVFLFSRPILYRSRPRPPNPSRFHPRHAPASIQLLCLERRSDKPIVSTIGSNSGTSINGVITRTSSLGGSKITYHLVRHLSK
ncbi:unnamed protein product [Ectocarpus sp. CCAP 1310/34]|nr:unnamed protein product [Ectocarpus sp. CCAP 1310/34]